MADYSISVACPKCRCRDYTKATPDATIAFKMDRVCKRCGTRYTPPTPRWAGGLFMLCGFLILGINAFRFQEGLTMPFVVLAFPGFIAFAYGLRYLFFPTRPVDV